jgi:hypothetical protein
MALIEEPGLARRHGQRNAAAQERDRVLDADVTQVAVRREADLATEDRSEAAGLRLVNAASS